MDFFTLLIKPSGSDCNIDCEYCFYKGRSPQFGRGRQRMSEEVLEKLVSEYMGLGYDMSGFAWQGGEPTLMGVDFFRKAVELEKRYGAAGVQVSNTMQTNGVLLDDGWCEFLAESRFLLGISIDGPGEFHDIYRRDHSGAGTYERVMRGIESCKRHRVEFSVLILLNDRNVGHPERLFEFIVEHGFGFVQFIPCIETDPATGRAAEFSITGERYGDFLCRLFDMWYGHGPEKINIRQFDSVLSYYLMGRHSICTFSKQCGGFVVIEHNGDAFCCEFFVEPEYRLGNILETPLAELAGSSIKRAFARAKQKLRNRCLVCAHLDICRGGCMKDRVRLNRGEAASGSYFCEGYKRFFEHSGARFRQIAATINQGRELRRTRSVNRIRLRIEK